MKKILVMLLVIGAASLCIGEMDNIVFDPGNTTAGQSTAVSYVMRGYLEGIKSTVGITAQTGTITITTGGRTIFTGTKLTGTNWYQPRIAIHGATGSALTDSYGITNGTLGSNALYGRIPLAGEVTVTYLNDTVGVLTNTLNETELIYSK